MFWISGQKILEAARLVAARANLHMVYITNFKCGPDSYIKHFARDAATRILFLDRGRVIETAPPERFFSSPETERARQFIQRYAGHAANGGC